MDSVALDPDRRRAVIFDLDGVVTDTAAVHFGAWKQLFDEFLQRREPRPGEELRAFTEEDYLAHVDGKPRDDGVASLLDSRGIELPRGDDDDPEDRPTVRGLGSRKNRYFRERLESDGVNVFDSTVRLVRALQDHDVGTAVISASRNCRRVLEVAGLADLFPVRVDGVVADELDLPGKPDPAVLLEAARRLDVEPAEAVVIEDARAGVRAGAAGGFGMVIGVDRAGDPDALGDSGADVVVSDLSEVVVATAAGTDPSAASASRRPLSEVPDALDAWDHIVGALADRDPVFFLDFDGTLAPIVDDPAEAAIPAGTLSSLEKLASRAPVAIVSGRDLADVRDRVPIDGMWFAGSHGFEISAPDGTHHRHPTAEESLPQLDEAESDCRERLEEISGVDVERKGFAIAVHYRRIADDARVDDVIGAVEDIGRTRHLRVTGGRELVELRPDVDWHKGRALDWLLSAIAPAQPATVAVYAGDDLTDEDALAAVHDIGLGIVVRHAEHGDRSTLAHVTVDGTEDLARLLARVADELLG